MKEKTLTTRNRFGAIASTLMLATAAAGLLSACTSDNTPSANVESAGASVAQSSPTVSPPMGDAKLGGAIAGKKVLVVGDNLAKIIGDGMSSVGASGAVSVVNDARFGCGIMRPVTQYIGTDPVAADPDCNAWADRWAALVADQKPDAVFLSTSFSDPGLKVLDAGTDPVWLADKPAQDRYLADVAEAVKILSAGGAKVYIDDLNGKAMQSLQAQAVDASAADGARLLPLASQFCVDGVCPATVNGKQVYDAAGYLSSDFRDGISRWILNRIGDDLNSGSVSTGTP